MKMINKNYFHIDNGIVYWYKYPLKGVDLLSFRPINCIWATDSKGVFNQNSRIRNVDASTFIVLNEIFAKDHKRVFCFSGVAKKIEDVTTFEVLDPGKVIYSESCIKYEGYARDARFVYYHDKMVGEPKPLRSADPSTFKVLYYGYAKDHKLVHCSGFRLKSADPNSFEILGPHFARDNKHVFYGEQRIKGADTQTFRNLGHYWAKDKNTCYFQKENIESSEPSSFRVIDATFAVDKKHVYGFNGKLIAEYTDDPTPIGRRYYIIGEYISFGHKILPEADKPSFRVFPPLSSGRDNISSSSYPVDSIKEMALRGFTAYDKNYFYRGKWTKKRDR